jgi:hypothetical protein
MRARFLTQEQYEYAKKRIAEMVSFIHFGPLKQLERQELEALRQVVEWSEAEARAEAEAPATKRSEELSGTPLPGSAEYQKLNFFLDEEGEAPSFEQLDRWADDAIEAVLNLADHGAARRLRAVRTEIQDSLDTMLDGAKTWAED